MTSPMKRSYWLLKTEPQTYSFEQLIRDQKTNWNGIRNFQARNFLKTMQPGDHAVIYHSGKEKAAVGVAEIISNAYPDLDPKKPGDWVQVNLEVKQAFAYPLSLAKIKSTSVFSDLLLIRQSRLSVIPLCANHYETFLKLSKPQWDPFCLVTPGNKADAPRSLDTPEGVEDRLRTAAFAEIQAREAFLWAASSLKDAPVELRQAWIQLAHAEQRHLEWLLLRMNELQLDIPARKVSDQLWTSLTSCKSAKEFALYMASAEERGRVAGIRFHQALLESDPVTAEIFGKIAEEETSHIALAKKHFPAH